MPSRLSHRLVVSALFLAVLLALAPPPAQAGTSSGVLDNLGAKVQSWLAAWLPASGLKDEGVKAPSGRTSAGTQAQQTLGRPGAQPRGHHGGVGPIKPLCNGINDPNGCT